MTNVPTTRWIPNQPPSTEEARRGHYAIRHLRGDFAEHLKTCAVCQEFEPAGKA